MLGSIAVTNDWKSLATTASAAPRHISGMMFATLASRITGFVRSVLLVHLIGGTAAAVGGQTFGVANELPINIFNLIAGGLLGAILVPEIVRAREDHSITQDLDRLLTMVLGGALVLTIVLVLGAPALVRLYALGWSDEWIELATAMAYWCLPQIFFLVVFSVVGQLLNAHHELA